MQMAYTAVAMKVERIIMTTDLSDLSLLAIEPALAMARLFEAEIILVHVVEDRIPPFLEGLLDPDDMTQETRVSHGTEKLQAFGDRHLGDAVPWRAVVGSGTPHEQIIRLADEHDAGIIVMATHGSGPLEHVFIGSTTERVVRQSPCPVLTVRETHHGAAGD